MQHFIFLLQIFIHPRFEPSLLTGDFALLQLNNPVPYSPTIAPICLPSLNSTSFDSQLATIVGWGITEAGEISSFLREVPLSKAYFLP